MFARLIEMEKIKRRTPSLLKPRARLRVGFLPVSDCAPLVIAHEFGLYDKYGVQVELQRETSWKSIHDKIAAGVMDAAHAPGTLPFLARLGLTSEPCDCVTGLVLSLQGNAITLSQELSLRGVHDATTLKDAIRRTTGKRTYTFGVVLPFSSQYFLLCQWLKSAGINPYTDVRIVTASPSEMFPLLSLGYLDGFCAGEPWTTVAVQAGVGHCVSTSAVLSPLHPEKVLMVREDFARKRADEHERLIAALLEACEICDSPDMRADLCAILAAPQYVDAPVECLRPGLVGPFGHVGNGVFSLHGLHVFNRCRANAPTAARAGWITRRFHNYLRWRVRPPGLDQIFRPDIFKRAEQLREQMRTQNAGAKEEKRAGRLARA